MPQQDTEASAEVLDPLPQVIQLGDPDAIPTTFQIRGEDGEDITPAVLGRLITAAGQLAGSAGYDAANGWPYDPDRKPEPVRRIPLLVAELPLFRGVS